MTFEQQINDVVEAATRQLSGQMAERLQGLGAEIAKAASEERASVVRELRIAAEAELAKRSQDAVAAAQAEHARRLEDAVAAARQEGARRVDDAMASARAQQTRTIEDAVAAATAELNREHQHALLAARADVSRKIEDAVAAARAQISSHHDALTASIRADAARALAEAVARTRADADQQMARYIDAARRDAHQRAERSPAEGRDTDRQTELAQVERLVESVRRLDAAHSLTDALDVLVEVVAKEAPRVAVFMMRGTRMAGWRGSGMPSGTDLKRLDLSIADGGLVSRAVRASLAVRTREFHDPALMTTPFGALPADAAGLAIALRVGGEPVAVLYADDVADQRREVAGAWPEAVELLARHAARCLEVLTVVRAAQPAVAASSLAAAAAPPPRYASHARVHAALSDNDDDAARRYAKLLVSEIKLYHEASVSQGRRDGNLLQRLRLEIDRARTLYNERVPTAVRTRADYFGQELVRTLANGDGTLLGPA